MRLGGAWPLGVWLALAPGAWGQEASNREMQTEVRLLRLSVERVAALLRERVDHDLRRDAVTAVAQRLEAAERRLAPLLQDLRAAQQRQSQAEADVENLDKSLLSLADMEKADTGGSATAAFEAERRRLRAESARKAVEVARMGEQVSALEAEIAARRELMDRLEAQLERLVEPLYKRFEKETP